MNDELRDYEQRLLDYIEGRGRFPVMRDKLTERFIDPEACGLADDQPPGAATPKGGE